MLGATGIPVVPGDSSGVVDTRYERADRSGRVERHGSAGLVNNPC